MFDINNTQQDFSMNLADAEVVHRNAAYERSRKRCISIIGFIPCGEPDFGEQEDLGYAHIPVDWVTNDCYLLRTVGDSMIDAGIESGALVLIENTSHAVQGDIVVAKTEKGLTLKRLCQDVQTERPYLVAENASYLDADRFIYPHMLTICGVVRRVLSTYEARRALNSGTNRKVPVGFCPHCEYPVVYSVDPSLKGKVSVTAVIPDDNELTQFCPDCGMELVIKAPNLKRRKNDAVPYKRIS